MYPEVRAHPRDDSKDVRHPPSPTSKQIQHSHRWVPTEEPLIDLPEDILCAVLLAESGLIVVGALKPFIATACHNEQ